MGAIPCTRNRKTEWNLERAWMFTVFFCGVHGSSTSGRPRPNVSAQARKQQGLTYVYMYICMFRIRDKSLISLSIEIFDL